MRAERRLAAILAADVVGFSQLMGADEEGTLRALKDDRRDLIDPALVTHRGRLVKLTGDGALAEFASVVDAVRCAVEIQRAAAARNETVPADRRLAYRIGINLGDVMVDGDDLYGDGVNVAARLEALAEPGSICVSAAVFEQVRDKIEIGFHDLGEQTVKNIARPIRVYRVEHRAGATAVSEEPRPMLPLPDKPSIAVLPFQNMSGDAEQDYFADGVVEDIITGLSRIKWLFVIARNSTFVYKGKAVDVKQVGRELGVRYVLEGSIRKAANRVRITAQLIDAATGTHVWAERYDRALDDIFALQDEITLNVVGAIEPSLRQAEIERAARKRPDRLDAYDLYLRALPDVFTAMPEHGDRGLTLLQEALALQPDYAAAHAAAAWCYEQRFVSAGRQAADRDAALAHARTAVSTGAGDATALAMAGFVIALVAHDFATGLGAIEQAVALAPSSALALRFGASASAWAGRSEQALDYAERALRLSPFDPLSYIAYNGMALAYFRSGRFADAAAAAEKGAQINPRFSIPMILRIAALVRLGRGDETPALVRRLLEVEPKFTVAGLVASGVGVPAVMNDLAEALREGGVPA